MMRKVNKKMIMRKLMNYLSKYFITNNNAFQTIFSFSKMEIFREKRLFLLILEEANNQIQNFIEFSGVKKGNDNKCRFLRSIFYCPQKSMFYVDMIKNKSSLNYTHKIYY